MRSKDRLADIFNNWTQKQCLSPHGMGEGRGIYASTEKGMHFMRSVAASRNLHLGGMYPILVVMGYATSWSSVAYYHKFINQRKWYVQLIEQLTCKENCMLLRRTYAYMKLASHCPPLTLRQALQTDQLACCQDCLHIYTTIKKNMKARPHRHKIYDKEYQNKLRKKKWRANM